MAGTVGLAGVVTAGIVAGFGGQDSPASHRDESAATPGIPLPALAPLPTAVAGGPGRRPAKKRAPLHHPVAATPPNPQPQGPGSAQAPPTPRVSSSAASRGPTISVRYLVPGQSFEGFEGEVVVVNNGQEPLSGWQIVVALEGDTVTSVENASGFVSNGILLMQPNAGAAAVPPGGTLRVFFTAEGTQTTPLACAFNGITCG